MLELTSVSKSFGGVKAVNDVSLLVKSQYVHGLIGPNGAGKTTLVNLISGLLTHNQGSIRLDGRDIGTLAAHVRAQCGVARTFQNLRIYSNLSVAQNIEVAGSAVSRSTQQEHKRLVDEAIIQFDLQDKLRLYASELSYGHMRRLEIVRALALLPSILMLDEPAAGMNEEETERLIQGLSWIRDNHDCALLVIDHDLKFIMNVCQQITVMTMGSVLTTDTPDAVSANPAVIAAYLGEGAMQ